MKKSTKVIASVAIAVVLVAAIVTISLFKEPEASIPATSFSVPSTTFVLQQPGETESFFDWDAYINSLDLSTEPESSTINPSDPTATVPSTGPNVVISIVYPSDYIPQVTQSATTTTTRPTTTQPVVQMVDYHYMILDGDTIYACPVCSYETKNSAEWIDDRCPHCLKYAGKIVKKPGSAVITDYFGSDMTPVIPSEINGYSITRIGNNCFRGTQITSVYIPSTVHMIDTGAFSGCTKLKNVYFMSDGSSVNIGASAFQNCKALTNIKLPQQTLSIGNNAFSGCSSLMKLAIPESVTEIGASAFSGTNEEFTIYCKQDSVAHAAAIKDGIKYILQ